MRKNAIVSLVFSLICLVFGVMLNIVGFRHALSPVSIQKYVGGFSMSMTVPGSMSFGFSSMSLMLIILGSSLLVCAAIFYAVFVYARVSEKRYVSRPKAYSRLISGHMLLSVGITRSAPFLSTGVSKKCSTVPPLHPTSQSCPVEWSQWEHAQPCE